MIGIEELKYVLCLCANLSLARWGQVRRLEFHKDETHIVSFVRGAEKSHINLQEIVL